MQCFWHHELFNALKCIQIALRDEETHLLLLHFDVVFIWKWKTVLIGGGINEVAAISSWLMRRLTVDFGISSDRNRTDTSKRIWTYLLATFRCSVDVMHMIHISFSCYAKWKFLLQSTCTLVYETIIKRRFFIIFESNMYSNPNSQLFVRSNWPDMAVIN